MNKSMLMKSHKRNLSQEKTATLLMIKINTKIQHITVMLIHLLCLRGMISANQI